MPTPPSISPTLSDILDERVAAAHPATPRRGFRAPVTDARRLRILQRTERKLASLLAKAAKTGGERF